MYSYRTQIATIFFVLIAISIISLKSGYDYGKSKDSEIDSLTKVKLRLEIQIKKRELNNQLLHQ